MPTTVPHYATKTDTDRNGLISRFVKGLKIRGVVALGGILHSGTVKLFKSFSVLEQIIVLRGNGSDARLDAFNDTRARLHALCSVGERFQNLALEIGVQTGMYIYAMSPNAIPANDLIEFLLRIAAVCSGFFGKLGGNVTLCCPFIEQLLPIAKVNGRHTVCLLVMQNIETAFPCIHRYFLLKK